MQVGDLVRCKFTGDVLMVISPEWDGEYFDVRCFKTGKGYHMPKTHLEVISESRAKYNPWMKIIWKMDDIWVIVDKATRSTGFMWKLRNVRTGEPIYCESGDMATISKKV